MVLLGLLLMEIKGEKKYAKAYQPTVRTTCHYFGKKSRGLYFPGL